MARISLSAQILEKRQAIALPSNELIRHPRAKYSALRRLQSLPALLMVWRVDALRRSAEDAPLAEVGRNILCIELRRRIDDVVHACPILMQVES